MEHILCLYLWLCAPCMCACAQKLDNLFLIWPTATRKLKTTEQMVEWMGERANNLCSSPTSVKEAHYAWLNFLWTKPSVFPFRMNFLKVEIVCAGEEISSARNSECTQFVVHAHTHTPNFRRIAYSSYECTERIHLWNNVWTKTIKKYIDRKKSTENICLKFISLGALNVDIYSVDFM